MFRNRQAGLGFILFALVIDILGIGLIVPVLPQLIGSFENVDLTLASSFYGLLIALYALMSFAFASAVGSLSDRFGRRPVLLLSLLGLGLDYIIIALAPTLAWLVVGRLLAGIFGALEATATAYIADVSAPEKRAQNFGLVGAAFGVGFILGPLLGGVLGGINLRLPFWCAAALSLLNVLYGLFVLPESLPVHRRRAFSWSRANPVGSLLALRRFPGVLELTAVFAFSSLALSGLTSVWVLYTAYRYGWNVTEIGISLSVVGVTSAIVQGTLVGPIVARLGEASTALLGLSLTTLSFALYALATQGWMLYLIIVIGAFGSLATPAVQGAISRQVPAEEQGLLQGALAGIANLTNVISPPLVAGLFAYFVSATAPFKFPGAALFLCTFFALAALLVARRAFKQLPNDTTFRADSSSFAQD